MDESAFPHNALQQYCSPGSVDGINSDAPGMTLRDYFAAKAMQGLCSLDVSAPGKIIASSAYDIAEAMILERARRMEKKP